MRLISCRLEYYVRGEPRVPFGGFQAYRFGFTLESRETASMHPTRRQFIQQVAPAVAALSCAIAPDLQAAIDNTEPIKITGIEAVTFRDDLHIGGGSGSRNDGAEFMWVRLHTDRGIVGTGETYPSTHSEVGALRDRARSIVGRDPRDIDGLWRSLYKDQAMRNSGGADMRILVPSAWLNSTFSGR